jgi:superfamily I DNA/RNA helicase
LKLPSYQLLSKEQDRINGLPLTGSYLVAGPPGTGKSVMALYRASLLQKKKRQVRVLMFSRLLKMYANSAIGSLKLDNASVLTMHQWIPQYFREHFGGSPPKKSQWEFDWQAIMVRLQEDGVKVDSPNVVVDEGQDLPKEFYMVARLASDHLTVFADENQRITDTTCKLDEIRTYAGIKECFELRRNYRNTREIAALAAHFYTGLPTGIPDPPERSGPKPVLHAAATLADEIEYVARYERNNSDTEIGVLLPSQRHVALFERDLRRKTKNEVRTYVRRGSKAPADIDFDKPGILLLTYWSAKGLEFDTVVLPALAEATLDPALPETSMMLYVLISRARENLYFTYSGSGEPPLVQLLPKELLQ